MCQTIDKSKTFPSNYKVSRILFVAGFSTLFFVQRSQSLPSRGYGPYSHNPPGPDIIKEEYDYNVRGSNFDNQQSYGYTNNFSRTENQRREQTAERRSDSNRGRNPSDVDAIEFPGEFTRNTGNFIPVPVASCEGKTFCEETASAYPQEYMTNIISRTQGLQVFSGVDEDPVVVDRFDSSDGGETLCGSETKIVYPKTARNGAKEWLFVLQDEKQGYKQGVKVENCNAGTAEGACQIIEGSILGYKTSCKQKYVSRILAAVHKNGTAVTENFSMPSSCCCQIRLVGDIGLRFGGVNSKPQQTPAVKNGRRH